MRLKRYEILFDCIIKFVGLHFIRMWQLFDMTQLQRTDEKKMKTMKILCLWSSRKGNAATAATVFGYMFPSCIYWFSWLWHFCSAFFVFFSRCRTIIDLFYIVYLRGRFFQFQKFSESYSLGQCAEHIFHEK